MRVPSKIRSLALVLVLLACSCRNAEDPEGPVDARSDAADAALLPDGASADAPQGDAFPDLLPTDGFPVDEGGDGGSEDAQILDLADVADGPADQGGCPPGTPGCEPLCANGILPAGATREGSAVTLACPQLELLVEPVADAIVRVRYRGSDSQPSMPYARMGQELAPPQALVGSSADTLEICLPQVRVRVHLDDCRVTALDEEGNLLLEDAEGGWTEEAEPFHGLPYVRRAIRRTTPQDELFYGFGEKTGELDKRGRKMVFWGTDTPGYPTDMDPLYVNVPFFVGLRDQRAYGLFVDNTWRLEFDMAASSAGHYRIEALQGDLDHYLIAGPGIDQVLSRYASLTGHPFMPPRWTLGYHQARWSYYPDSKVKEICEGFRSRNIPADGIWLDIDYMDGFRSFTWSPAGFPDPSGLVSELAAMGFKTTVIIDPGLKADPGWPIYDEGVAQGHFLMEGDSPFVGEVWPGASVFPDFTRAATRTWWGGLFPAVTDVGVRGVWLDMNEPANFLAEDHNTVPGYVTAHGEGTPLSMDGVHNTYALAEAMASYEGLLEAVPNRRPFLLTRSGFAGIQRYAAVWTGDAASTMESLRDTFTMLLGLGLSGVPFVGSDVGGWTGSPSPELFARWIEVGAVSPFFRAHVATGTPDQEPWSFGVEVEEISRIHIRERYRMLPYLYSLFHVASQTGLPILRAMPLEFQEDPVTFTLSTQGMIGPWLLVAPVLESGATTRTLYLPDGHWLEWRSGRSYQGPGYVTVNLSLQALPLFLREGAIVPRGPALEYSDQGPLSPLQLDLLPGSETSTFTLYEDDGDSFDHLAGEYASITYSLQGSEGGAVLSAGPREGSWQPPSRPLLLRFRPVDKSVSDVRLDGQSLSPLGALHELDEEESGWFLDANDRSLWVVIPDQDSFELACDYDPTPSPDATMVNVPVLVHLPPGTPQDTPIHIATSAAGWTQQPLSWGENPSTAVGLVPVPRGEWFEYKYTRGDWTTVEKWEGCLETTNRYAFGTAAPVKEDVVETWADQCR
jgi:alpha-glucosidase